MSAGEAAYARAHGALVRLLPDVDDPSDRATECLATLRRLGWRWVPQTTPQPESRQPAPPPDAWHQERERLAAQLQSDGSVS